VALNGILNNALTALRANQTALSVVSQNVSNINTDGYVRRQTKLETISTTGQVEGVDVADITRAVNAYLDQETLSASGTASQYDIENTYYKQVDALLGNVGDGNSTASKLSTVTSALATASQAPSDGASISAVINSLQDYASSIADLSASLTKLQNSADAELSSTVNSANTILARISNLNQQIGAETAMGNNASGLCDQRDQALSDLSQMMDIKTATLPSGAVKVSTNDGFELVNNGTYAQLSYAGGLNGGGFSQIQTAYYSELTGRQIASGGALDPHLDSGKIEGLLTMRDDTIGGLKNELGTMAKTAANAFNEISNAHTAVPPPKTLSGHETGLTGNDALNFTGTTTIAVANSGGNLVSRIDVDFTAGTLSVNGGAAVAFGGTTIDDFVGTLNTALGANGSASYANGKLTIAAANSSNGIIVADGATASDRGGSSFSTFFGLNDIFQTSLPSITATGLAAADTCQTAGTITMAIKDANGNTLRTGTVNVTGAMTVDGAGGLVAALNAAMGGTATFALNPDGSIATTMGTGYGNCKLVTVNDTTSRGSSGGAADNTGVSITDLFGIGDNKLPGYAANFSVAATLDEDTLPKAKADLTGAVAGDNIAGSGDAEGLVALEGVETAVQPFAAAGSLNARNVSLSDYANAILQDASTRASSANDNYTRQSDRLTEAQKLQASDEGVNLDEELSNMVVYQHAYSAAARMLTTLDNLYQTLLSIQ
jgi:flagellar hook-associated protein 1